MKGKGRNEKSLLYKNKTSTTEKSYRPFELSDIACPVALARGNVISMKQASSYRSMDRARGQGGVM